MTLVIFLVFLAILVMGPKKAVELAGEAGRWKRKFDASKEELLSTLHQQIEASPDPKAAARAMDPRPES